MPFAATQKDLKITILSEVTQRKISHHLLVESNQNKLIFKTETNSQISKSHYGYERET